MEDIRDDNNEGPYEQTPIVGTERILETEGGAGNISDLVLSQGGPEGSSSKPELDDDRCLGDGERETVRQTPERDSKKDAKL